MTHVSKISDDGKDVVAGSIDDLVFKSVPTVSIRERKALSLTTDSGASGIGSNTYVHGFGYIPQLIAFVTTAGTGKYINVPCAWEEMNFLGGPFTYSHEEFRCYTTSSTLTIWAQVYSYDLHGPPPNYYSKTYNFDILILMEEALTS